MIVCLRTDVFLEVMKISDGFSDHANSVWGPLLCTWKEILEIQKITGREMNRTADLLFAGEKLNRVFCSKCIIKETDLWNALHWEGL